MSYCKVKYNLNIMNTCYSVTTWYKPALLCSTLSHLLCATLFLCAATPLQILTYLQVYQVSQINTDSYQRLNYPLTDCSHQKPHSSFFWHYLEASSFLNSLLYFRDNIWYLPSVTINSFSWALYLHPSMLSFTKGAPFLTQALQPPPHPQVIAWPHSSCRGS